MRGIIFLTIMAVPSAGATLSFSPPALLEGTGAGTANWFVAEGNAAPHTWLTLESTHDVEVIYFNQTRPVSLDSAVDATDVPPFEEVGRTTFPGPINWKLTGLANLSMVLESEGLQFAATGTTLLGSISDCVPSAGFGASATEGFCPGNSAIFVARLSATSLSATGPLSRARLHGFAISCQSVGCPISPEPERRALLTNAYIEAHYQRDSILEVVGDLRANLTFGHGSAAWGGRNVEFSGDGQASFPRAKGWTTCHCHVSPNGTLVTIGPYVLDDVRPRGSEVVAGFRGDFSAARIDETWIDPALLNKAVPVAATAGVAIAVAALAKLALALFTRSTNPLDHPNRKSIMEWVDQNPGTGFRELLRGVNLPAGTARHHLNILRRNAMVVEHNTPSSVRIFPNHGQFDNRWRQVATLREPHLQQLHELVLSMPGKVQADILDEAATRFGWSRSTTQHRLKLLVLNGVLTVRSHGRLRCYVDAMPKEAVRIQAAPLAGPRPAP